MFRAKKATCLTGVFCDGLSTISTLYGISLNPLSEYYMNYKHEMNYTTFNDPGKGYVINIHSSRGYQN